MTVSFYGGFTQSGKSRLVEKKVLPNWPKVIVFDNAHCFDGDIFLNPSIKEILAIFNKYRGRKKYNLVIRPGRGQDASDLLDMVIQLACALGRVLGKVSESERVQLAVDEADFVCSPHYQSKDLKHLVNKGRHDNVDSHFIARNPNRVHTDIRANASKIVCFRLTNASEINFLVSSLGKENTKKLQTLQQYHYCEWRDTGLISFFDENSKLVSSSGGETMKKLKAETAKKTLRKL